MSYRRTKRLLILQFSGGKHTELLNDPRAREEERQRRVNEITEPTFHSFPLEKQPLSN